MIDPLLDVTNGRTYALRNQMGQRRWNALAPDTGG
jgi:hypothetical protein